MSQIPYPGIHRWRARWRKVQGQFFIRYADRHASTRDPLLGLDNLTRLKTLNLRLNLMQPQTLNYRATSMASRTSGGSACPMAHIGTGQDRIENGGDSLAAASIGEVSTVSPSSTMAQRRQRNRRSPTPQSYFHSPCITNAAQK